MSVFTVVALRRYCATSSHNLKCRFADKIMRLQVFPPGDEPLIAAAVMDLFALLPQASHFVEALVKQTIRLESALPKYKPCRSISPFRDPLAKYLNRHFASKFDISSS